MFTIKTDDLTHPAVQALVAYHISGMLQQSPPESSHALDVQKLRNPAVTFWSVWEGEQLAGIGALKLLDDKHGETEINAYRAKLFTSRCRQSDFTPHFAGRP